ncbi:MAG: 2,3-bisphosphoglycerate-independent phosphoglycerate mutase [Rickettsiales bacterium]
MSYERPKPVVLTILDGWGYSTDDNNNAINLANTPNFDKISQEFPKSLINASENYVGLPEGQVGNSEVGHMNIGSGRVVLQDLVKIDKAIDDGSINNNPSLINFIDSVKRNNATVHLLGLFSDGGVHSHYAHILEIARIFVASGLDVKLHLFLDGRDCPPRSAHEFIMRLHYSIIEDDMALLLKYSESILNDDEVDEIIEFINVGEYGEALHCFLSIVKEQNKQLADDIFPVIKKLSELMEIEDDSNIDYPSSLKNYPAISIATISGRYYAMDRDNRWSRIEKAYDEMVSPSKFKDSYISTIEKNYDNNVSDEFIEPFAIKGYAGIKDGDGLLMCNFRADRARQILSALLQDSFSDFTRKKQIKFSSALGMSEYSKELNDLIPAIFPHEDLCGILSEIVSKQGLKQLHIAETEKYAHVTFFFNGGREEKFVGEEHVLIPSPTVATYDLKPEMSAYEVTDRLINEMNSDKFDFIVVNYANADMVGHTGNLEAAIKAVEAVDECIGKLFDAVNKLGGVILITADHGNAEKMFDAQANQPHTSHTLNIVPLIIAGKNFRNKNIKISDGVLADIAPTILQLLAIQKPTEMTGKSLLINYA